VVTPRKLQLASGQRRRLTASENATFAAPSVGKLEHADARGVEYVAPKPIDVTTEVLLSARAADGRTAHALVELLPDLHIVRFTEKKPPAKLAKPTSAALTVSMLAKVNDVAMLQRADPALLAATKDQPLAPGGSQRFAVTPSTEVTWTVSNGPGRMGDPA